MDHEGMGIEGFIHHVGSSFWFFLKCNVWFLHILHMGTRECSERGGVECIESWATFSDIVEWRFLYTCPFRTGS